MRRQNRKHVRMNTGLSHHMVGLLLGGVYLLFAPLVIVAGEQPEYDRPGAAAPSRSGADGFVPSSSVTTTPSSRTVAESWSQPHRLNEVAGEYRVNWFDKRDKVRQARVMYETLHDRISKVILVALKKQQEGIVAELRIIEAAVAPLPQEKDVLATKPLLGDYLAYRMREEKRLAVARSAATKKTEMPKPVISLEKAEALLQEVMDGLRHISSCEESLKLAKGSCEQLEALVKSLETSTWDLYQQIDLSLEQVVVDRAFYQMKANLEYATTIEQYVNSAIPRYTQEIDGVLKGAFKVVDELIARAKSELVPLRAREAEVPKEQPAAQKAPQGWLAWLASPFTAVWNKLRAVFGSCS